MPPFTVVGAIRETSPVGMTVPLFGATVTAAVTDVPCVMVTGPVPPLSVRLAVVPVSAPTAVFQSAARFVTFTEPRPVAVSYPVPAVHAGVVGLLGLTKTPFTLLEVLLQLFVLFALVVHGTESLPFVMSRKAQEVGGGVAGLVNELELQLENVSPFAIV